MQFPIIIGLHRSRFLDGALIVTTLVAIGVVLALPYSTIIRLLIALLIAIASYHSWRKLRPTLSAIRLERAGQILVSEAGSTDFLEVELTPGATVHPWLTVVRLQIVSGKGRVLIVLADSLRTEDFRRLRVFLRWRAKFSSPVGDA